MFTPTNPSFKPSYSGCGLLSSPNETNASRLNCKLDFAASSINLGLINFAWTERPTTSNDDDDGDDDDDDEHL